MTGRAASPTEFGGNWLDFRHFENHNSVDRERFPAFTNQLRQAMFEESILLTDVIQNDRPVMDLLYGDYMFVNRVLARRLLAASELVHALVKTVGLAGSAHGFRT